MLLYYFVLWQMLMPYVLVEDVKTTKAMFCGRCYYCCGRCNSHFRQMLMPYVLVEDVKTTNYCKMFCGRCHYHCGRWNSHCRVGVLLIVLPFDGLFGFWNDMA